MTSQVQTAWHKVAVLTAMSFQMSVFNKQDQKVSEKLLYVIHFHIYIFLKSIPLNRAHEAFFLGSPLVTKQPVNWPKHQPTKHAVNKRTASQCHCIAVLFVFVLHKCYP